MKKKIVLLAAWLLLTGAAVQSTTITFPSATYPAGSYDLPSTAINAGISGFTFSITPTAAPAVSYSFSIDLSPNSGADWLVGWCAFGGKANGNPSKAICPCDAAHSCNPASSTNRVRGTIIISGGSLTASGSIVAQ